MKTSSKIEEEKKCKNCIYFNAEKIGCKHKFWDKCIKRDSNDFVIKYVYFESEPTRTTKTI